jgi:hypothetical protein
MGKQFIAFSVNIKHSQDMCDEFTKAGVSCKHVDCYQNPRVKQKIYSDFKAGKFLGLCNCKLVSEAADFPAVEVLIFDKPVKSKVRLAQMFGRGARLSPSTGKKYFTVYDHSGCLRPPSQGGLGHPCDFEVGILDDGKPKKKSEKKDEKPKEPTYKECPNCYRQMRKGCTVCPSCGFSMPQYRKEVAHIEGELVKLKRGSKKHHPTSPVLAVLAALSNQSIFSQLTWVATERGYSDGWKAHKYRAIFGVWPRGMKDEPQQPCGELLSWIHSEKIKWLKEKQKERC